MEHKFKQGTSSEWLSIWSKELFSTTVMVNHGESPTRTPNLLLASWWRLSLRFTWTMCSLSGVWLNRTDDVKWWTVTYIQPIRDYLSINDQIINQKDACEGTRTLDHQLKRLTLYLLSYTGLSEHNYIIEQIQLGSSCALRFHKKVNHMKYSRWFSCGRLFRYIRNRFKVQNGIYFLQGCSAGNLSHLYKQYHHLKFPVNWRVNKIEQAGHESKPQTTFEIVYVC